ncbi:unnamed protein product [Tuber aestivum]|uniref:Uncharacterized protein n=1 Tax=Tuber aestivum TaxID=59557 RepID=A0A292Q183_9PEZI|nr:unnamed protein product [Tuber aestivum]
MPSSLQVPQRRDGRREGGRGKQGKVCSNTGVRKLWTPAVFREIGPLPECLFHPREPRTRTKPGRESRAVSEVSGGPSGLEVCGVFGPGLISCPFSLCSSLVYASSALGAFMFRLTLGPFLSVYFFSSLCLLLKYTLSPRLPWGSILVFSQLARC